MLKLNLCGQDCYSLKCFDLDCYGLTCAGLDSYCPLCVDLDFYVIDFVEFGPGCKRHICFNLSFVGFSVFDLACVGLAFVGQPSHGLVL